MNRLLFGDNLKGLRDTMIPVATARPGARRLVAGKLDQINELVRKLLGSAKVIKAPTPASGENQAEML